MNNAERINHDPVCTAYAFQLARSENYRTTAPLKADLALAFPDKTEQELMASLTYVLEKTRWIIKK